LDLCSLRERFLAKRVDRRQAETLIVETEARDAADQSRRGQQALDDWYRFQLHRGKGKTEAGSDKTEPERNELGKIDGTVSET
jgi:hypothetical protein